MANGKIKWITLVVALIVLGAGLVSTWVLYGENIKDNTDAILELDTEGCKPTGPIRLEAALTRKDVENLQKTVDEIQTEQKAGFKEILKRLPK